MKGLDLMWRPFKALSIVEYRVVVDACLFDLILKLVILLTAVKHVVDFLLQLLVIHNRQGQFLTLSWQQITWILLQQVWYKYIVLLITVRQFEPKRVSDLFNDLIRTLVLVSQLLTRTFACPVLSRYLYLVLDGKVNRSTVLISLDLLLLLSLYYLSFVPLLRLVNPPDLLTYVLPSLTYVL